MIQSIQFMIQSTPFGTQNTLFVNEMTQNTYGILATVKKIITYALGEHDPGSAQNIKQFLESDESGGSSGFDNPKEVGDPHTFR